MSENAEALSVILEEAGAEAFRRICARLCGDRVWFPHKRHGLPISVRIVGYLRAGYDVKRIAHHLECTVRYVQDVRRREAKTNCMAKTVRMARVPCAHDHPASQAACR